MGGAAGFRLRLSVPGPGLALFERALAGLGGAIVLDAPGEPGDEIPIEVYLTESPDPAEVTAALAAAAAALGLEAPAFALLPLPALDWVAESQKGRPPVKAGRFFVFDEPAIRPPASALAILIAANQAFGTGHHESTKGCLLALDTLASGPRPRRLLDLGCGSGVLAIAMAKLWHRPVAACDVDPQAVAIARANARLNGAGGWVRAMRADGPLRAALRPGPPYDVIAANILAGPLCALAGDLSRALAPGGRLILSGLLTAQERQVLARYRAWGLVPARRIVLGDWLSLVLAVPKRSGPRETRGPLGPF